MTSRSLYRREALIRNAQPEALDDLLRVTSPHERVFKVALLVLLLMLTVWTALSAWL